MDRECIFTFTPIDGGLQYVLVTLSTIKEPIYADELMEEFSTTLYIPYRQATLRIFVEGVPGATFTISLDLPEEAEDIKITYSLKNDSEEFVISV
jgi:hypothetical protein